MNYMLAWVHPGLTDVMLSGVIKISVSLGGKCQSLRVEKIYTPALKCLSLHPKALA